jgi:metallo-beta-lactamase family protein
LGSQITAGKSPVNIFGEPHDVRAKVASLDTYSGHADRSELKQYVQQLTGKLRRIFCIHGEETQCLAHAETLRAMKPAAEVIVPEYQQTVEI